MLAMVRDLRRSREAGGVERQSDRSRPDRFKAPAGTARDVLAARSDPGAVGLGAARGLTRGLAHTGLALLDTAASRVETGLTVPFL